MISDQDLLAYAGRMATAAEIVLGSTLLSLSEAIQVLRVAVAEYNYQVDIATEERLHAAQNLQND